MSTLDLLLALGGAAALLAAILPEVLARRPLSLPLVYLLAGLALFALPIGLPDSDPIAHRTALEHITELCVVISLMGAGLAINSRGFAVDSLQYDGLPFTRNTYSLGNWEQESLVFYDRVEILRGAAGLLQGAGRDRKSVV